MTGIILYRFRMVVQLDLIKDNPYFTGLQTGEMEFIRKLLTEKSYDRGEMIVLDGETARALFFVISGAVKIFKTSVDGKEQILEIIRPGQSFNDVPIFDTGLTPISAQAMSPVLLYELDKNSVETIVHKYPRVASNVITVLAKRVRSLVALVEDLSFRTVLNRVAKILLDNAADGSSPGPRLTQQEMAAMAGTAREVVGRSLKILEEEAIIQLDRHRIIIKDKEALRRMAGAIG
jgi:CRP-like cAMP-binding protein